MSLVASSPSSGVLQLRFVADEEGTALRDRFQVAPLRVHRAFRGDDGDAIAQLVNIGPGLLGGDHWDVEVVVESGAKVVLVAQSATKVHTMAPDAFAGQRVRMRVASGAWLEVHGGLVIPFPGAAFRQHVEVALEPGARFVWTERWCTGRERREQWGRFRSLDATFELRVGDALRFADRVRLAGPAAHGEDGEPSIPAGALGLLEGHRGWVTGLAVGIDAGLGETFGVPEHRHGFVTRFDASVGGYVLRSLEWDMGEARDRAFTFARGVRSAVGRGTVDYLRYGS